MLEEMKAYIGFGADDAANLRALAGPVERHLPAVVDRFYVEILRHSGARSVLAGGEAQVARLRGHLLNWLRTLFCGVYNEAYVQQRAVIGHAHVRVGLPQHYMFGAMEVVREELERIVRESGIADFPAKLGSLNKLLTLELGMMLESYKTSYSERARQLERDVMQERLSRAEQLAEVGHLAASLAHEIKNPLAGISGAIQVIREEMDLTERHRTVLDEILRQIARLDGTVKDLLTYARPRAPRFEPCTLRSVVEHVLALLGQEKAFQTVKLECDDCAAVGPMEMDEHQIEQLLVNLLLNAAQASTSGGSVQLRIGVDGDDTIIVVQDNGQGMDEESLRRAFEPFFTTKARGTGLGLPICQRIVDAHGGVIVLRSELGQGTAVEVRLPRRQKHREGNDRR